MISRHCSDEQLRTNEIEDLSGEEREIAALLKMAWTGPAFAEPMRTQGRRGGGRRVRQAPREHRDVGRRR